MTRTVPKWASESQTTEKGAVSVVPHTVMVTSGMHCPVTPSALVESKDAAEIVTVLCSSPKPVFALLASYSADSAELVSSRHR